MRAAVAISMVLAGCAISTTPSTDAGSDARTDVGIDAYAPDTHCDVLPAPRAIPMLRAGFDEIDPAIGSVPPVMSGGDPVGVWVFDHGTFWVDRAANAMFNRFASSVSGTAWMAITPNEFRLDYELTATLAGTAIGTIDQHSVTRARVRWRLDHEQLEPIGAACTESNPPPFGDPGRITFTRVDATHLTLLTDIPMASGTTIMELHGTLAP